MQTHEYWITLHFQALKFTIVLEKLSQVVPNFSIGKVPSLNAQLFDGAIH
jgi:hypothetical protein